MIRDILRFNREASSSVGAGKLEATLGDLLQDGQYSDGFVEYYSGRQAAVMSGWWGITGFQRAGQTMPSDRG